MYANSVGLHHNPDDMPRALHLDPPFAPYPDAEQIAYDSSTFPGGEPHLKLAESDLAGATVHLTQRARSWNDFGLLAIAADALRRAGAGPIHLTLPYFPGARQDRVAVPGEALTIKVYANFINALQFASVTVFDPHSAVTPALLDDVRVVDTTAFAKTVLDALPADSYLVAPDAGAQKKVYHVAQALGGAYDVVEAGKKRDVRTGKLSGFHAYADDLNARPCLLLDDICDGGGTFLGLAEALRHANAGPLYLAVSHGIFSKGLGALLEVFTKVYCTDAFDMPEVHDGLEVVPLAGLL